MNFFWGFFGSFIDSIFFEDEFIDRKKINVIKQELKKVKILIFGVFVKIVSKFDDEIEDFMNDFELGFLVLDVKKKILNVGVVLKFDSKKISNGIFKLMINLVGFFDFKCLYFVYISLFQKWRELFFEFFQVLRYMGKFFREWFKYVLGILDWLGVKGFVN